MKQFLSVCFAIIISLNLLAQAPVGYYTGTDTLYCQNLKTALKSILSASVKPQSYASLWKQYPLTDVKPRTVGTGSATVIYDIYSSIPNGTDPYQFTPTTNQCGNYSGEGACYNREHSVPLSWFGGNTSTNGTATDYNFIFPTDGKVNAERSNYPYGEVATASYTSENGSKLGPSALAGIAGDVFEPRNDFKGDVARAFLYFVTMYEDNIPTWSSNADAAQSFGSTKFPGVTLPFLQMMLRWNDQDPVSQKEIDRNNGTYAFQNNRNPFIDSPQYVHRIWGGDCPGLSILPVNIIYFTGKQIGSKILLNWEVGKEANLSKYIVEKSFDGEDYMAINTIDADGGTNYSYADYLGYNKESSLYYRIKKIDKNGIFNYSSVFKLNITSNIKVSIYPNPVRNLIHIELNNVNEKPVEVVLTDAFGRIRIHQSFISDGGEINIPTGNIPNGNYYLRILNGEHIYSTPIIIIK